MLEYYYRPDNDSYYFTKEVKNLNRIRALGYVEKEKHISVIFGNATNFKKINKMNELTYHVIINFIFTNYMSDSFVDQSWALEYILEV